MIIICELGAIELQHTLVTTARPYVLNPVCPQYCTVILMVWLGNNVGPQSCTYGMVGKLCWKESPLLFHRSTFSIGHHFWIPLSIIVLCHFVHSSLCEPYFLYISVYFPIVFLYGFKSDDQF